MGQSEQVLEGVEYLRIPSIQKFLNNFKLNQEELIFGLKYSYSSELVAAIDEDPLNVPEGLMAEKIAMDKANTVIFKLSMTLQLKVVEAVVNMIAKNIKSAPVDLDACAGFVISKFSHAFGRWFDKLRADSRSGNVGDVINKYDNTPETILAEMETKNCLILLENDGMPNAFFEFNTLAKFVAELTETFLKETTMTGQNQIKPAVPAPDEVDILTNSLEEATMSLVNNEGESSTNLSNQV